MEEVSHNTPDSKRHWFEPVAALLMAISSLSTAWCSFQNSRWSGQSGDRATHADKLARKVSAQHLEARQIEAIQTRMWMEAVDARLDHDEPLARFYTERFAEELKPAYEKWMALNPFENPSAPAHPFVAGLYVPRFSDEIHVASAEAEAAEKESNAAGHVASSYLSNTVLLATVLFFAGTAGKFHQRRVRSSSLFFAIALFCYAAVRTLLLPIA
jgi:hypothetical protein